MQAFGPSHTLPRQLDTQAPVPLARLRRSAAQAARYLDQPGGGSLYAREAFGLLVGSNIAGVRAATGLLATTSWRNLMASVVALLLGAVVYRYRRIPPAQ